MKSRTMNRIGAAAALVTLLTGITALSKVHDEGRAEQPLVSPRVTSADDASLIAWLSTTTLPMLDDARAVINTSRHVEVMPPMVVQGTPQAT